MGFWGPRSGRQSISIGLSDVGAEGRVPGVGPRLKVTKSQKSNGRGVSRPLHEY